MIGDFFKWWVGELAGLVPERWRRSGSGAGDALIVAPVAPLADAPDAVLVTLRRGGRETALGRFALGGDMADLPRGNGRPVVLRLAAADILAKTLSLPLAAERQLGQVLAFEMDRETPFGPDEVFWSHRVVRRDRQRGQVAARLMLVPRGRVEGLVAALSRAGVAPIRVEIGTGPDEGATLPLTAENGHREAGGRPVLRWAAATSFAALAAAVVLLPFLRQESALAEIDQEIARARSAAAEAQKLRDEIGRLSGAAGLIESERDKNGRPLVTMAALTRLLPDDTYLTELQLQQRRVTLSGRSAGASRLIGALAAGDQLKNPAFAAPVTRIEATKSELFSITAEAAP